MFNFQVMLLLIRGDPKGYEEKKALEREVNCLESYLEALPSLCVLCHLKGANPEFFGRLGLFSFYRLFYQTCFTMTLFLKSGPCFIFPKKGFFGGIFTWRFIAIFVLNQLCFKIKFVQAQFDGGTYIANAVCVLTLGAILGLFSIHQAVGSWKSVFSLLLKFPPLLFLPIFGFATFGVSPNGETFHSIKSKKVQLSASNQNESTKEYKHEKHVQRKAIFFPAGVGLVMNLRWTWVNFVASVLINRLELRLRFLINIQQVEVLV